MVRDHIIIVKVLFRHDRVFQRTFEMLERLAFKGARAVLRGLGGSNASWLPDSVGLQTPNQSL